MAHDPAVFAEMVALTIKAALTPVLERVAATEARVARLAAVELTLGELRDKCVTLETKAAMSGPVEVPEAHMLEFEGRIGNQISLLRQRISDLREAVQAVEAKAALPHDVVPSGPSAAELGLTIRDAVEPFKATLAALGERIAVLEARPLLPGPAGKDGAPGLDGKNGTDGISLDDLTIVQQDDRTMVVKGTVGARTKEIGSLTFPVQINQGVMVEGRTYQRGDCVIWDGSIWIANETTSAHPRDRTKAWTLTVKRGRDGRDGKDAEIPPVVALGRR